MRSATDVLRAGCRVVVAIAVGFMLHASPASAQVSRIDVSPGGIPGNGPSLRPVVSFDGRYVAFVSDATNLVGDDANRMFDFFRYDRQTGHTIRGQSRFARTMTAIAFPVAISHDGRWLLFTDSGPGLSMSALNVDTAIAAHANDSIALPRRRDGVAMDAARRLPRIARHRRTAR